RLRERATAGGGTAALVSRPANVRYLGGTAPQGAVLLLGRDTGGEDDLLLCARAPSGDLVDGRLDEALRVQVLDAPAGDPAVAAADVAAARGDDSLAVEEHHLTVARHRALGSVAPRLRLLDLNSGVEQLRLVKD